MSDVTTDAEKTPAAAATRDETEEFGQGREPYAVFFVAFERLLNIIPHWCAGHANGEGAGLGALAALPQLDLVTQPLDQRLV